MMEGVLRPPDGVRRYQKDMTYEEHLQQYARVEVRRRMQHWRWLPLAAVAAVLLGCASTGTAPESAHTAG